MIAALARSLARSLRGGGAAGMRVIQMTIAKWARERRYGRRGDGQKAKGVSAAAAPPPPLKDENINSPPPSRDGIEVGEQKENRKWNSEAGISLFQGANETLEKKESDRGPSPDPHR